MRQRQPPKPQWVERAAWVARQPDLLTVAREALPYLEGLLALHERTSSIEAYEDTKRIAERLKGAIAKEESKKVEAA